MDLRIKLEKCIANRRRGITLKEFYEHYFVGRTPTVPLNKFGLLLRSELRSSRRIIYKYVEKDGRICTFFDFYEYGGEEGECK
ncbi:hypothetical protein NGC25_12125 [Enterococcus faecalis]|uniref:hypothetical protein n=1 Tax=Enterococcus faecalis TaxID=1351 RepID=UPI001386FEA7|nr:hypothetical protein [Enterococcus faecalis]MEB7428024.1 hypothetical protein [Enterococcus faecalis]